MKITKTLILLSAIFFYASNIFSQTPNWINSEYRSNKYPENVFLTSFAQDEKLSQETSSQALERVKEIARSDISKNLITKIKSINKLDIEDITINDSESFKEIFKSSIKTESSAEINGLKTESYFDEKEKRVYAFSFANKFEIIGYYKASIGMNMQQIGGLINAAKQFLIDSEKMKAKEEYLKTVPIFAKVEYAQGLLIALDKNADENNLQTSKSIELQNLVKRELAELEQAIFVKLKCNAVLFTDTITLLENKIKSLLAENGCSFSEDEEKADWIIKIDAKAREFNNLNSNIYFSYVDAIVKLTKRAANKNVYNDEISKKGGSNSYKDAGKKAYSDLSKDIVSNILKWIIN